MLLLIFTPFPVYSPGADITVTAFSINDMATPLGTFANLRDIQFQDQLSESGAGRVTLQNDDPQLALINPPFTVIRFDIQGWPAWTMIFEEYDATTVSQGELADQVTVWSGRGHLALLERGVIYPSGGVGRIPVQDDRTFTWTSIEYDDSTWINATVLGTAAAVKVTWGVLNVSFIDQDYPNDNASMLWATSGTVLNAPDGDCYFRKVVTITATGRYLIYWLTDNTGDLYVDGALVDTSKGFWNTSTVLIDLSAGDHVFAAKVTNFVQAVFNPGGFLLSVYSTDSGGLPLAVEAESDGTWKILQYPAVPPGMTPGQAIRICVGEWQARGGLAGVTLNFSDTIDSAAQPWPVVDLATKVGTDILTFVRELAGAYIDVWMDPESLSLSAWNYGTRGQPQAVTYQPPTNPQNPNSGNVTAIVHKGSS